eukprot:m.260748 g.260748  ORF g.260748 m.260748 type:complete len:272 (-) comp40550_c0_seq1:466-1281(-)
MDECTGNILKDDVSPISNVKMRPNPNRMRHQRHRRSSSAPEFLKNLHTLAPLCETPAEEEQEVEPGAPVDISQHWTTVAQIKRKRQLERFKPVRTGSLPQINQLLGENSHEPDSQDGSQDGDSDGGRPSAHAKSRNTNSSPLLSIQSPRLSATGNVETTTMLRQMILHEPAQIRSLPCSPTGTPVSGRRSLPHITPSRNTSLSPLGRHSRTGSCLRKEKSRSDSGLYKKSVRFAAEVDKSDATTANFSDPDDTDDNTEERLHEVSNKLSFG